MGHGSSRDSRHLPAGVTAKFSSVELNMLTKSFENLAQRSKGKTIDKETFLNFFPLPGLHGEKLFEVFDHKGTGVIDYEEFITGLAVCVRGTFDEKVKLIFNIYDIDNTHFVSREELRTMLIQIPRQALYVMSATVTDQGLRKQLSDGNLDLDSSSTGSPSRYRQAAISDIAIKVVDRLVEDAFSTFDLNKDDRLSLSQFREWVKTNPEVLDFVESVLPLHESPAFQSNDDGAVGQTDDDGGGISPSTRPESPSALSRALRKWSGSSIGSMDAPPSPGGRPIWRRSNSSNISLGSPCHPQLYGHDPANICKSGVLYKTGRRTRKMMARFFLLRGQMLYYYYTNKLEQPAGIIFLQGCFVTSRRSEKSNRSLDGPKTLRSKFSEVTISSKYNKDVGDFEVSSAPVLAASNMFPFEIITSQGGERDSRVLYAKSEEDRQAWLSALKKASNVVPFEDKYHLLEQMGKGKFAVVFKCELLGDNDGKEESEKKFYAVKVIDKGVLDESERELLRTEIAVLKLVNHPNIINMEDVFESLNHIYIVLECVEGGELFDRIVGRARLSEVQAFPVIKQLAEAVSYLHILGVAHRDIKPENILCHGKKEDPVWESTIKICDFGLSQLISPQGLMTLACGTLSYVAPEVLSSSTGYGKAADVWNIGVIHYLVRRGRLPFDGDTKEDVIYNTIHAPLNYSNDPVFSKSSPEEISLLEGLLSKNPKTRLTATKVLDHPWMIKMEKEWKATYGSKSTFLDHSSYGTVGTPAKNAGASAAIKLESSKNLAIKLEVCESQKNNIPYPAPAISPPPTAQQYRTA